MLVSGELFSRSLELPHLPPLPEQSLGFVPHSNKQKQIKSPISLNQLGNLSDQCLRYEDSHRCHGQTLTGGSPPSHCSNVLPWPTARLKRRWSQKTVAGQALLSRTRRDPPGRYQLLVFSYSQGNRDSHRAGETPVHGFRHGPIWFN